MKTQLLLIPILILVLFSCTPQEKDPVTIDESSNTESIVQTVKIDSVWAGHPVGFSLYTHGTRQYIAYYNANRNMVVGQRNLDEDNFHEEGNKKDIFDIETHGMDSFDGERRSSSSF